jgi:hypothetical protein
MKKLFKETINVLLSPVGIRVSTVGEHSYLINKLQTSIDSQKHLNLIEEVQNLFSELVFPALPPCQHRSQLMAELIGTGISEAIYILQFLNKSLKLEGDVCEFGVAQGTTSALLANEIRATEKNLWLFDSFKGLPKPTEKDLLINDIFNLKSMESYEGTMSCPVEMVESRLKAISFPSSRTKIVPGFIEETINSPDLPKKVCFAYVDFDFYQPILTALRFLNCHLSVDGVVIVDDYDFFSSGAKTAVDEFLEEYPGNYEIIKPYKFAGHFCVLRKIKE